MQDQLSPTGQDTVNSLPSNDASQASIPMDDETTRRAAAELIRRKVAAAYGEEPNAKEELKEVVAIEEQPLSKHQAFMRQLSSSGKSLVEIQSAWHAYYNDLPDDEKHQVWQEFYAGQKDGTPYQQELHKRDQAAAVAAAQALPQGQPVVVRPPAPVKPAPRANQTVADIKRRVLDTVSAGGKLQPKHHLQSLAFGVAAGLVVVFIFLFSFFNEVIIAPFIQPSRHANATPVIVDPASAVVGQTPKVIIPKINVEIPVDYSVTSIEEKTIEAALDKGIVHYPTTVRPGETGNAAYFGHSSNNIFNPGKYKFAFVLLHELVQGDTFYLTNDGTTYAYKVISRRIVDPSEVGVLGTFPGQTATATLITCDPPGTSLKRLVVVGEQISPTPGSNTTPAATPPILTATEQTSLPGNGPTLWSRLWGSLF